ncbi:alpha-L-rhamnosidase-related protein [Adhaeribacter rhizoryzae]|uniref:Bacterial alpha-L-rhamnosidase n=1 Tax=Adhaeribacter rhizoryzae TaxID=2607907 RepID=A0A5M6DBP8_9BACT|nr:family 78 glycoside hydrolase catalytic domain [Adhaeribacter rhizoryzae]KAA5543489.1 Bacterial alpha-L-rhamnosidase [Adhaeribacter rhizoryzae]
MHSVPISTSSSGKLIFQSERFAVFSNKVVQDNYEARALSRTELISNYKSPANTHKSPRIYFKFSLNGFDNEMEWGEDHIIHCLATNGICEAPIIKFGQRFIDTSPVPADAMLAPHTRLKLRLDLREVLTSFQQKGFFTTYNGTKIFRHDFKGVFVAGSVPPLSWNFDRLGFQKDVQLHDADGSGIYEIELTLNPPDEPDVPIRRWELSRNIADYPQYESDYTLLDALYNLSLEEMEKDVEPDNTFRTGLEWAGVWTRDVSYSTILAMAVLRPDIAQNSLLHKVKNNRIIQDTGTGGAYPVSTDRQIWAVAAWEIFKVTGDQGWLQTAYTIIRQSITDDEHNIYDGQTGLVRGESSFLDWREQTYPDWMQPADIFESICLSTNAVHYAANWVLAQMAELLGDKPAAVKYAEQAEDIKTEINDRLWLPEKKYYGQYLYGRLFKTLSPRADALGEALCVLFNIADPAQQQEIVANTPVNHFGTTNIYPQIPDIPPYHNNAVWPFVQAFWTMATAKAGNENALMQGLAALYRPTALFLTNKENYVASDGDFAGTEINSDEMLWSLSGNLSAVYKILFGLEFGPDKLIFKPFVPAALKGNHKLTNFRYRQAQLDIHLTGYGNIIRSVSLNDQILDTPEIPATLMGKNIIRITLANATPASGPFNLAPELFSPAAPFVTYQDQVLSWLPVPGAAYYKVLKNGKVFANIQQNQVQITPEEVAEYQVIAVDNLNVESFASEPLLVVPPDKTWIYEAEDFGESGEMVSTDYSGNGFAEISQQLNRQLVFTVNLPIGGRYALDFRYANGNGPVNTNNKCALRTLKFEADVLGTVVFPQRGDNHWADWGYSNAILAHLPPGNHQICLSFEPANENMDGEINQALIDYLRIIKVDA